MEAAEQQAESEAEARLDGLNILIVDDNHMTCEVLATVVGRAGGIPFVAHSVAEAKEQAAMVSLDSALIDLAMPGESGIALIEYLRKHSDRALATIPLIVVSACVFDSDRRQALECGASDFIAKPFRPHDLIKTIRYLTTAAALEGL
jgi:DNA-binding response OmpR family regulator